MLNGYDFEKGSKKYYCPECKKRSFKRFINSEGQYLPDYVGICDHSNSCGYMYHAKQYFEANNIKIESGSGYPAQPDNPLITDYYELPAFQVNWLKRFNRYEPEYIINLKDYTINITPDQQKDTVIINYFVKYLVDNFGFTPEQIRANMERYETYITMSARKTTLEPPEIEKDFGTNYIQLYGDNAATVLFSFITTYLYKDITGCYNTGREILYKPDFHRVKNDENGGIRLIHKDHNQPATNKGIKWNLYGEHLLYDLGGKNCVIVESEKTAFVMSLLYPSFIWLATGGLNQLSKDYKFLNSLPHYTFIPDSGQNPKTGLTPFDNWTKRIPETVFRKSDYSVIRFNDFCTPEQITSGCDLLDLYLTDKAKVREIINQINQ